jgi:hypothetical protein
MDTSFWIQCNPKIKIENTAKKYFNEYLYKLVLYAPVGRIIDAKGTVEQALEHRKVMTKNINHAGWWGQRFSKDLENANVELLAKLREIRQDRALGLKLRVEEPRIQIYAKTADELVKLVKEQFDPDWYQYVETVAGPANKVCEDLLNSGGIIRKTNNGFKYKVIIRDGRYGDDTKRNVLNYLINLGEEQAHVTSTVFDMLHKPGNSYIWNAYFYVNDPNVTSFISLMSPGMIGNIHELIVVADK